MKIPQFAKEYVVKLILSKYGPAVQKAFTLAASAALGWLSTYLPGSERYITPEVLTGLIWVVLDVVVTKLAAGPLKEYAKQLQDFMAQNGRIVKKDAYIGPVMVEMVKEEITAAQQPTSTAQKPSKSVKAAQRPKYSKA
jgi:hypothetical protein